MERFTSIFDDEGIVVLINGLRIKGNEIEIMTRRMKRVEKNRNK